jgi:hypothetical protein
VKKISVSNGALTMIVWRKIRTYPECPSNGAPIAIVPVGGRSEWQVLIAPYIVKKYPLCAKRVAKVQAELQKIYALARK